MQNITSAEDLKNAIQLLKAEQSYKGQLLKKRFYLTCENLKPVNLLKHALNDVTTSPNLIDYIIGSLMGLVTGFISKKIIFGGSGNLLKRLVGFILQLGVTTLVAKHHNDILAFSQNTLQHFLQKNEMKSDKP